MTLANDKYFRMMEEMCGSNAHAYRWFYQLIEVVNAWDHLVDGDELSAPEIDRAFTSAVLEWGMNPFYHQFAHVLIPACVAAVSSWKWSNWAGSPKIKAYDIYTEIPTIIAFLLGGQERVDRFIPDIRSVVFEMHNEDEERDNGAK